MTEDEFLKKWEEEAIRRGITFEKKNMKYTDRWFKFPVKIYDGFSVHKAIMIEDKKLQDNPEDIDKPEIPDWVMGYARIPVNEIQCWIDYYSEGRETSEVAEEGFDLTMVETKNLGKFECLWKREKFEKELDDYYEKSKDFPII